MLKIRSCILGRKERVKISWLCDFHPFLRKERDSNPRNLSVQRFSRPPQSTTLPSFLFRVQRYLFFRVGKTFQKLFSSLFPTLQKGEPFVGMAGGVFFFQFCGVELIAVVAKMFRSRRAKFHTGAAFDANARKRLGIFHGNRAHGTYPGAGAATGAIVIREGDDFFEIKRVALAVAGRKISSVRIRRAGDLYGGRFLNAGPAVEDFKCETFHVFDVFFVRPSGGQYAGERMFPDEGSCGYWCHASSF